MPLALDVPPSAWPSLVSCAVGLAALVLRVRPHASAKDHLIGACLMLVVVASAVSTLDAARRARAVDTVAATMLEQLGTREMTLDELRAESGFPDEALFGAALDRLVARGRMDSRTELADLGHRRARLRLWFAMPA